MPEEHERHGHDALVGRDLALRADRVAEMDRDAVRVLVDRVDLRAEAGIRQQQRREGVGEGVGARVDVLEIAEHVVVPVGEPLHQREVEATLEVEQRPEEPERRLAHAALDEEAKEREPVVLFDEPRPAAGLRHQLDQRRHRLLEDRRRRLAGLGAG